VPAVPVAQTLVEVADAVPAGALAAGLASGAQPSVFQVWVLPVSEFLHAVFPRAVFPVADFLAAAVE